MNLRPHQELAIQMARQSIRDGFKRPIIGAATSFGKTILAAQMMKNCQDAGKKGWFFCDRIKLVDQTIDKFRDMGINFGVRQADHELKNAQAPIQIASIQTVQAMVNKHNGRLPEFDFAIVDECHVNSELINSILQKYNGIPIIGLSATPYTKGLGNKYNNLIVPITPRELEAQGYLTPVRYYGGGHVDLSKISSSDANTYSSGDLESATDTDKERLTGCIIKNWLEYGERAQTIAFSPSQNHSKYLCEKFTEAGILSEHIDCYTSQEERNELFEAHDAGEFKILSCSRLLNTGYDAPQVRCLIDCFPTKSVTTYVQRVGRLKRTSPGKEYAIYLDHADNFTKFGFAEDIVPDHLDMGDSVHREADLTKKDKKEAKTRDCPQCFQKMAGPACRACGYNVPVHEQMEDDGSMLKEITEGNAANKKDDRLVKEQFFSQMTEYAKSKGYKPGYAAAQYKDKYQAWPPKDMKAIKVESTSIAKNWIKSKAIARRAQESKGKKVIESLTRMFDEPTNSSIR